MKGERKGDTHPSTLQSKGVGGELTDDSKHGCDYEENEDGVQDRLQRAEDPVHNLPHFLIFSGAESRQR